MYKIMIFIENSTNNFLVQNKDEEIAKATAENIRARRKSWLESGKDCIVTIAGDDYGHMDVLASKIVNVFLMFQADGVQIPLAVGRA